MKTQVVSPISGKAAKFIRLLNVSDIVQLYQKELALPVENYFGSISQISIYECLETGYRFYYPFNIMGDSEFYAALQSSETYYPQWKWENEKALTYIKSSDRILDVGCGEGNFLKELYKRNIKNICGIDQSSESLVYTQTGEIPIYNETIETFSLKNKEVFDVLVCFQILEHITDVRSFIAKCLECLKPGGLLVLAVPNNNPYLYRYDVYHPLNLPPHHAGLWNKESLEALSSYFGLKLITNIVQPIGENVSEYTRVFMVHLSAKNGFFKWLMNRKFIKKLVGKIHYMQRDSIEGRNCLAVYQKINKSI